MKFSPAFLSPLILLSSPASLAQSAYKCVINDAKRVAIDGIFSEWKQ